MGSTIPRSTTVQRTNQMRDSLSDLLYITERVYVWKNERSGEKTGSCSQWICVLCFFDFDADSI